MTARNVAGASTLVVYYSAHGHTRRVAKTIIRALGADAFALAPATAYSEPDLNYNDPRSRVSQEHIDRSRRHVELVSPAPDGFAGYSTVLIGYPIWWGEASWVLGDFVRIVLLGGRSQRARPLLPDEHGRLEAGDPPRDEHRRRRSVPLAEAARHRPVA